MCKYFQESVKELSLDYYNALRRHNYVTPASYLELILTFKTLLHSKRQEVDMMRNRYLMGLRKLDFAASQVSTAPGDQGQRGPGLGGAASHVFRCSTHRGPEYRQHLTLPLQNSLLVPLPKPGPMGFCLYIRWRYFVHRGYFFFFALVLTCTVAIKILFIGSTECFGAHGECLTPSPWPWLPSVGNGAG